MTKQSKKVDKPTSKYRVIPNLSLKGPDIMQRLKNRTLTIEGPSMYNLSEEIEASRKLTRSDLVLKHMEVSKSINSMKQQLQRQEEAQRQESLKQKIRQQLESEQAQTQPT